MATYITGRVIQDGEISSNDLTPSTAQSLIPPGAVMSFAMSAAPVGWLPCDGSAISRSTYAPLFSAVRTTFGVGNSSTTFNVPDLRGEFIRGWAIGRNVGGQSTRAFGSTEGDAIRDIVGWGGSTVTWGANGAFRHESGANRPGLAAGGFGLGDIIFRASYVVPTAADNRPRNIALLYCIKF
jgi:phage-related tail fiber protein